MNAMSSNIYYNPGTHTTHYETDYVQECLVERGAKVLRKNEIRR